MKKNKGAITRALAALDKRFGEPVVRKMNDAPTDAKTISSGRPELDDALGGGYVVDLYADVFSKVC